jgi:hypothetical protein
MILLEAAPSTWRQTWFLPAATASTALLSWCAGRYLQPAWLSWTVFAWSLVLLDLVTIAAGLTGPINSRLAYTLVSTQISLLIVWAVLGQISWQWRLPAVVAAAAGVVVFTGSFSTSWISRMWNFVMILTAVAMLLFCVLARLRGFVVDHEGRASAPEEQCSEIRPSQFGILHMLVWATAVVPMLIVVREGRFAFPHGLDAETITLAFTVAVSVALTSLATTFLILGRGFWLARFSLALTLSVLLSIGLHYYLESQMRTATGRGSAAFQAIAYSAGRETNWPTWFWSNIALSAACLLFLRARGYRLMRVKHAAAGKASAA